MGRYHGVCFCILVYEPYMEQTAKGMLYMVVTVQPVLNVKFISFSQTVSKMKWFWETVILLWYTGQVSL